MRSLPPRLDLRTRAGFSLRDARGRPLRDIRISLTDHCNLRCTYCMPAHAFPPEHAFLPADRLLAFEELTTLVQILAGLGVRKVKLTGGEPLGRPFLPKLVRMLRQGAPEVEIALITNGILLAPMADDLRKAGLDRLTISLDSRDPARFAAISGRGNQLDKVLAGLAAARRAGFDPIKINMVVIRGINDDEVVDMAQFFRRPDTILRYIEYMDVGTLNQWRRSQVVPAAEILARLRVVADLVPITAACPGETATRYRYADGTGEVGFIASITQPFCGDCSRLRLSADGKLFTCLFAQSGLDIKNALRTGGAGAVHDALVDLWQRRADQYSIERSASATHDKIEMFYIGG
ncbi:MAG: GTP 3',8-cyclase MoaA [Polyangia bacterium]